MDKGGGFTPRRPPPKPKEFDAGCPTWTALLENVSPFETRAVSIHKTMMKYSKYDPPQERDTVKLKDGRQGKITDIQGYEAWVEGEDDDGNSFEDWFEIEELTMVKRRALRKRERLRA